MCDDPTLAERRQAAEDAVGTLRLEGLELDEKTLAELDRLVSGETTVDEVLARLNERVRAGEFSAD